jgi:hypothetical protein
MSTLFKEVSSLISCLKISDDKTIGEIMSSRGYWTAGTSARNNSFKILKSLADQKFIRKGRGYFATLDCKSNFGEHARLLTQALAQIIIATPVTIFREHTISEIGLRPDAVCLVTKNNRGLCFILEVLHNETPEYFKQKLSTWKTWGGATRYLSQLFGYEIPHFSVITAGQGLLFDETLTLDDLLKELKWK